MTRRDLWYTLLTVMILWLAFCLTMLADAREIWTAQGSLTDVNYTAPTGGIEYYEFRWKDGALTIAADGDTSFARAFREAKSRRVVLTITPYSLEKLER